MSIPKYPFSEPQKRELITEKLFPGTAFANMPFTVKLGENINFDLLEESINMAIARHDGIRIRISAEGNNYKQYFSPQTSHKFDFFDFSSDLAKEKYELWLEKVKQKPLNLIDSDLFYFALIRFPDNKDGFYINCHHITGDGACMKLIIEEIARIYKSLLNKEDFTLEPAPSYLEYFTTEENYHKSDDFLADKKFWEEKYAELPPEIILPFNRSTTPNIKAKEIQMTLKKDLTEGILAYTAAAGITANNFIVSGILSYISKITRNDDVVIGMLTHNRRTDREKKTFGMFANVFPFRMNVKAESKFSDFAKEVSDEVKYILKNHSRYPFGFLANDLRKKYKSVPNLLNIIIVGQDFTFEGTESTYHHPQFEQPPYHLIINIIKRYDNYELIITYPEGMFTESDVRRISTHLMSILESVVENPDRAVSNLPMVSEQEKTQLLSDFNNTYQPFDSEKTIIDLFEEQVQITPDNYAVVFEEQKITYSEFNKKANDLAWFLKDNGVGKGDIVSILMDQRIEMITGIFGILKSGAAYLPIDPAYPDDRINFIVKESGSKYIFSSGSLSEKISEKKLFVDITSSSLYGKKIDNPPKVNDMDDLCYVIYTSGSTGKPKGVMIGQRNLANFVSWMKNILDVTPKDNFTKFAGYAFDASMIEIYPSLLSGASLHIISSEIRLSPKLVNEYFNINNITISFLPTQFAEQFMEFEENSSLRWLITGGDKLKSFKKRPYSLLNVYGPTECTVISTSFKVEKSCDNIPIGKPIHNFKTYVLDAFNNLMPVGVPGELCISGEGVGKGYMNDIEKTNKSFINNPFTKGQNMYRSGDLVRWCEDGNIEFLGRIDFQVKIRGFRIEIGEIENQILKLDKIKETIVIDRLSANQEKFLVAYFVAEEKLNIEAIKERLAQSLPGYMIPAFFIQLEKMPLNASGKIDRKALPEVQESTDIVGPTNAIEAKITDIWKEVLSMKNISITDSFFNIGGDSLSATIVLSKIEKEFSFAISYKSFFKNPTIQKIAETIQKEDMLSHEKIETAQITKYYPATSAQKRFFMVEKIEGTRTTYNIPNKFEINGPLDTVKLAQVVETIINRHEALRTTLDFIDNEIVQIIHDDIKIKRNYYEVNESDLDNFIAGLIKPFDLKKAPLFRVALIKVSQEKHILFWDIHHAIYDGSSMVVLLEEIVTLYNNETPRELFIQYKDFAIWQKKLMASPEIKKQEDFWMDYLAGELPVTDLPSDFGRTPVVDYRGENLSFDIDETLTVKLHELASTNNMTLNMVMSAAYNIFISKYCQSDDIITGMGSSGRNHLDTEYLIGMFVNTLPLRTRPKGDKTFREFLEEIRDNLLDVFDNQDYQFEEIVKKVAPKRDPSRNPIFNVGMVFQSMGFPELKAGDITIKPLLHPTKIARFDHLIEIVEKGTYIETRWEYRTSLFKKESIERMADHFKNILISVTANPDILLRDIELTSEIEKKALLYSFNATDAEYPKEKAVHQIFTEIAAKFPDRTAVFYMDQSLSYKELDEKSNQLAHFLRSKGVVRESIVAMLFDTSPEMMISMLAIMKAGGCYLPLKPDFPQDRIEYMLKDSGARHLISSKKYYGLVNTFDGEKINASDVNIYKGNTGPIENVNTPRDSIYIIYTSGSTGKPKGVILEHYNVVRLLINSEFQYKVSEQDVWSMFHSYCFDFSVWEIYGALLYGGKLLMVPKDVILNPADFLKLAKKEKVTVLSQTPGAFYNFIAEDLKTSDHDLTLRYVTFGGEALKPSLLKEWHKKYPETRLINMYGITETCVHVTFKDITDYEIENNISNIGFPIPTLRTYIMDSSLKLLPVGIPGEICVAGDGLARGYLGKEELTKERFPQNPYIPEERIYRSGDLAKRLSNGEMEYLGRIDFQVKIRGFRLEIGEIENHILKNEKVNKVIVIAKKNESNENYLVAYYVSEEAIPVGELRLFLAKDLPDYMIPAYFVHMNEIPLNANGKADKTKLPNEKETIETGTVHVDTVNHAEEMIQRAWRKVLEIDRISTKDNFFDLGGDSLNAVSLACELEKDFEVVVNDIFKFPTISELASNLKQKKQKGINQLEILKTVDLTEDIVPAPQEGEMFDFKEKEVKEKLAEYRNTIPGIRNMDYSKKSDYKHILLTGSTGYLGAYLLYELLKETKTKITLIVRGKTPDDARGRLNATMNHYFGEKFLSQFPGRFVVLHGDLSADKLGLDDNRYKELSKDVDALLNPAANTKHYGVYEEFFATNVQSVLNLIKFSKEDKKKDLHHVSTLSVGMGQVEGKNQALFTEEDIDIGQKYPNVYVETKFEAEKRIDLSRKEGTNINIYRVGNITFDTISGAVQKNIEDNGFFQQVRSFINLGVIPEIHDKFDLSFADQLAKCIVKLMFTSDLTNQNFHLFNPNQVKLSDVLSASNYSLHLNKISFPDFIDFIIQNHGRTGAKKYIQNYLLHTGLMSFDENALAAESTQILYSAEKTLAVLKNIGFEWPDFDPQKMQHFIDRAIKDRTDFFNSIEIFKNLDQKWIYRISTLSSPLYADEETNILWEGSLNDKIFFVESGNIEISKHSVLGWLGTVSILGRNEFFGEESLLEENISSINADAVLGDVTLYTFDKNTFVEFLAKDEKMNRAFIQTIIKKKSGLQGLFVNM